MEQLNLSTRNILLLTAIGLALLLASSTVRAAPGDTFGLNEVLVYPTREEGSIMHWLCVSPLKYDAAYIGDSMSYDVFKREGISELTARPRAGDTLQALAWRKMAFNGTTEGPTMCSLFDVAGHGFDYGITLCCAYLYSPADRPNAIFSGSADDALKVILDGTKIWSNQIQRSPTYDSDQAPAPLKKGWNTLLCDVDQVIGGHLLTARFLDGGQPVTDLEISLDPPAPGALRHPALQYNAEASGLIRNADLLEADGKLEEAITAYEAVLKQYPLSEVAPRAAYARATTLYNPTGEKSLNRPQEALKALHLLLDEYGQDPLAEYALLDLGRIQEAALKDPTAAAAAYRSFEDRFPRSTLAAKSVVALARLLAQQKQYEQAILTYRKAIQKYPNNDEVMTATVGIADTYSMAGQKEKARQQYQIARTMAADWHDNKYGVDVGKQAWLQGILDDLRRKLAGEPGGSPPSSRHVKSP